MSEEVEFVTSESRRLACLDVKGPYQEVIPSGFKRLFEWAGPKGYYSGGGAVGIYHDSPEDVPPEELRCTVAIPVAEGVQGEGDIRIETLEPRQEAAYTHKGPYEEMGPVYGRLIENIFKSGHRIAGPCMEFYMNDPHEVPPEEILTEIRIPVERA